MAEITRERREEMRRRSKRYADGYPLLNFDNPITHDELRALLDAADERDRLREALTLALPLLEAFKENLDHLTCGDLCDASHEFRGCHGRCALDASKDAASAAIAAARSLLDDPDAPL